MNDCGVWVEQYRKEKNPESRRKACPSVTLSTTNSTSAGPEFKMVFCGEKNIA